MAAAFTRSVTWRATFWLIAPLALCVGVLLYFLLPPQKIPPEPLSTKLKKIDWFGGLFSSVGSILLLIPISGIGTQFAASDPMVISMLTLGSFFLVLFLLHEWKTAKLPMFPCRLVEYFLIGATTNRIQCDSSITRLLQQCLLKIS